jgi:hypothetical protein
MPNLLPLPQPSGSCGILPIQATLRDHSKHRKHRMADVDLQALSLPELTKMQKDVTKAISTFDDRQKVEARAKVEALARELGYSLAELAAPRQNPPVHQLRRNTGTLKTRRSPGPVEGANRSGSWTRCQGARPQRTWPSVDAGDCHFYCHVSAKWPLRRGAATECRRSKWDADFALRSGTRPTWRAACCRLSGGTSFEELWDSGRLR